jgi:hypothetical protein
MLQTSILRNKQHGWSWQIGLSPPFGHQRRGSFLPPRRAQNHVYAVNTPGKQLIGEQKHSCQGRVSTSHGFVEPPFYGGVGFVALPKYGKLRVRVQPAQRWVQFGG